MTKTITRDIGEGTTGRIKPRPRRLQLDSEPATFTLPIFLEVWGDLFHPDRRGGEGGN